MGACPTFGALRYTFLEYGRAGAQKGWENWRKKHKIKNGKNDFAKVPLYYIYFAVLIRLRSWAILGRLRRRFEEAPALVKF